MHVTVDKQKRLLRLLDGDKILLRAPVALGRCPKGAKRREGDGKTPEGVYTICLVKHKGKYGRSLGLNYPNAGDARAALREKAIAPDVYDDIVSAVSEGRRPPWGTALGGEIYIHEGGTQSDWTNGCIALNSSDMDILFDCYLQITRVEIYP